MKIVAIGGGEIGRPGHPVETLHIDKEIVGLSGKPKPRLLFAPTASGDSQSYIDTVEEHFARRLSCQVRALKLYDKTSFYEINEAIEWADISKKAKRLCRLPCESSAKKRHSTLQVCPYANWRYVTYLHRKTLRIRMFAPTCF